MSQSHDQTRPTYPITNDVPPTNNAEERKKMGRRALIAAAGLGVVGVGVAEGPKIIGDLGNEAVQNAINFGRQQLAKEIADLEGIGVEAAIGVADVARGAVDYVVAPIITVLADITEGILDVGRGALQKAQGFTQLLGFQVKFLQQLDQILGAWQVNVAKFPQIAKSIGDADTGNAVKYLTALQQKLHNEGVATKK